MVKLDAILFGPQAKDSWEETHEELISYILGQAPPVSHNKTWGWGKME